MCKFDERNYANSHRTFDFNVKNVVDTFAAFTVTVVATTALSS